VGSVVANELLGHGDGVTVIVRGPQAAGAWERRGAQAVVGSLGDQAILTRVLRGAAGFFAILPEDASADDFHGVRRGIASAMAAAVGVSGVPHVVLLSAVAAVLPDGNGPAKDLHYLENALRATGTSVTALRAAWFQENIAMVIQPAMHAGIYPNMMPSADITFPTIATRDVGRIAAGLLRNPPQSSEVVDLFGPSYSVSQQADALGAALGKTLQIVDIPAAGHIAALTQAGLSRSFAESVAELYACFAAQRITPQGDRSLAATTTLEEVLPGLLTATSP
jgi:uncharacterized protein YbjT (DUF2867 family)